PRHREHRGTAGEFAVTRHRLHAGSHRAHKRPGAGAARAVPLGRRRECDRCPGGDVSSDAPSSEPNVAPSVSLGCSKSLMTANLLDRNALQESWLGTWIRP